MITLSNTTLNMETEEEENLPPGFRCKTRSSGDGPSYRETDEVMSPGPEEVIQPVSATPYKDKLQNKEIGEESFVIQKEWEIHEGDVLIDNSGTVPKVTISSRAQELLARNMQHTAILRPMGRNIGYKSLQFQIMRLWKPKGIFHLIELGNSYYMVRFVSPEDYLNALTQGPWVIFGSYLTVQPWTPSFTIDSISISSIVAWIRLPNLPFHLYHNGILEKIAGAIGKVYRVDRNTSSFERGKYARFAVGIDLTKPLLAHLEIEGRKQRIEYEGLPSICFKCGTYGHLQGSCPSNGAVKPPVPGEGDTVNTVFGGGFLPAPMDPVTPARELATKSSPSSTAPSKEDSVFGPWMQVTRRSRRPAMKDGGIRNPIPSKSQGVARGDMGSRFVSIAVDTEVNGEQNKSCVELGPSPCEGRENDDKKVKVSGKHPATPRPPNFRPTPVPSSIPVNSTQFILPTPQVEPMGKEHHDGSGESSGPFNPKMHVDRNPLQPRKVNNRILDPTKHTVTIIEDDSIYFGPSSFGAPQSLLSSLNNKENFCYPHEPPKAKRKGINLSKNLHKTIKIRSPKNQPSSQPSEQLKMAILNSLSGMEASPPERN